MRSGGLRPLTHSEDVAAFSCDDESLDRYLHNEALKSQESGLARTHVWTADDDGTIQGYTTIVPVEVTAKSHDVPRHAMGSRAKVPAFLIAKMAIVGHLQRQGHGTDLLVWTLGAIVQAADLVGGRLILVEAGGADMNASFRFYQNIGFEEVEQSYTLWMPMDNARETLRP